MQVCAAPIGVDVHIFTTVTFSCKLAKKLCFFWLHFSLKLLKVGLLKHQPRHWVVKLQKKLPGNVSPVRNAENEEDLEHVKELPDKSNENVESLHS